MTRRLEMILSGAEVCDRSADSAPDTALQRCLILRTFLICALLVAMRFLPDVILAATAATVAASPIRSASRRRDGWTPRPLS